jgi:hypothetical protein
MDNSPDYNQYHETLRQIIDEVKSARVVVARNVNTAMTAMCCRLSIGIPGKENKGDANARIRENSTFIK